jgi:membrane protein implicated in regulation of membrane protease activity
MCYTIIGRCYILEQVYTIVFWVGVIYTVVTFLLGGLFGLVHLDGHIDTHVDSHLDIQCDTHIDTAGVSPTFTIFPLKPITIVSFLTVFGGIGMMGTSNGLNAILLFVVALVSALITAFILYRFIVVPLYKAQNTSDVSRKMLIGMKAKVISPILEEGFGTIAYVVNGKRYNAPAQHIGKKAVPQGEEVIIYEINNHIFYVQPINEKN